jgi:MFS family permease
MSLQAQAVIIGWHIYALRSDPLLLGLIGLAEAVPAIGFAFFSGHVVDKRRPAAVYQLSLAILVLNSIGIWLAAWDKLPISEGARIIALFVSVFVSGGVRSFTSPSVFSLIAAVVPRHQFSQASAWNSWGFQMAAICGPALGGILYGTVGPTVTFAIPCFMIFLAFLCSRLFSVRVLHHRGIVTGEPFLASIRSALRFAVKEKVLLSAMTLDMFSVLFGGAVAVLPVFSDQVIHAGAQGLGFLRAAPAVGSALIALFLAFKPLNPISGRQLIWTVAGFGASLLGFAFSRSFATAFVFLMASGGFDGVSMVIRSTILQLLTPENMRGRISSLSLIFVASSNEIGAFESGLAARLMGLIPSLIFGACMTLSIVGVTAWFSPELRRTRINPHENPPG